MSTLKVTNIAGLTGSSTNVMDGLAKAWGIYQARGASTLHGSFNVSSFTDNAEGQQTLSFSTSFANTNYAHPHAIGRIAGSGHTGLGSNTMTRATGSCQVQTFASSGNFDMEEVSTAFFGDLA